MELRTGDTVFSTTAQAPTDATIGTESSLASTWSTNNSQSSAPSDGIFHFSFGRYAKEGEGIKSNVSYFDKSPGPATSVKVGADCGATPLPSGWKTALGDVNSVPLNPQTIMGTGGTVWPIDSFMYNGYANGSNTTANFGTATPATLNYVSEVGFLCKPQTTDASGHADDPNDIIDPSTGVRYHTEIFNAVLANGFIPLDATVSGIAFNDITDGPPVTEGSVATGANTILAETSGGSSYGARYTSADAPGSTAGNTSIPAGTTPLGYCQVSSADTDGTVG